MFDASFINKIVELSGDIKKESFGGVEYTNKEMFQVPVLTPDPIQTHSLKSVVDFCERNASDMEDCGYFVHVNHFGKVTVLSPLDTATRTREKYLVASLISDDFGFGRNHDVEKFIISIQAQFVQDDTTATILKLVGNLTAGAEKKTLDDGMTQTITAKVGIAVVGNAKIPNPVTLRPYRTFAEVEQPSSKFVLRMKAESNSNPQCALYEADGGAWKNEAISNIKGYLIANLPVSVSVIG